MPAAELTLDESLERYLRHVSIERGLALNTVAAYRRDLGAYLDFLAAARRHDARPRSRQEDVSAFSRELRTRADAPLTASSTARMLSSVRGFHRYLLDEDQVTVDVAASTKPPKLGTRLPKAISIEQMAQVLDAARGETPQALRDTALLELLYATGARISEAVDLNVDDVIEGDVVRLFGKGGKQRIVPLGSYARAAIDAYLVRARPVFSVRGTSTPALFLGSSRAARLAAERVAHPSCRRRARQPRDRDLAAHVPALVRDPPARRRRGCSRRAGTARPLIRCDHPDLHARHRRHPSRHVHDGASAGALTVAASNLRPRLRRLLCTARVQPARAQSRAVNSRMTTLAG